MGQDISDDYSKRVMLLIERGMKSYVPLTIQLARECQNLFERFSKRQVQDETRQVYLLKNEIEALRKELKLYQNMVRKEYSKDEDFRH